MGCEKEPMPIPPCKLPDCSDTIKWVFQRPDSLGTLPILWYQTAHAADTSGSDQWCFATEEGVLLVNEFADGRNKPYVRLLDRETGEEIWYWEGLDADNYTEIQYLSERDLIMVKNWSRNAILNAKTGEVLFNTKLPQEVELLNSPQGRILGDYFYTSIMKRHNDPKNTIDYSTVIRTRIHDGTNWEQVYTLLDNEIAGYTPDFSNMELWMHPNSGDSILLINNRLYHWEREQTNGFDGTLERSDVIAYNLTKRKVEWSIDSICKSSELSPFMIDNDDMYFPIDGGKLAKINLLDPQKIICTYNTYGGLGIFDHVNEALISQSLGINAVSLNSCSINWKWTNETFGSNGIELFDGYIYTASTVLNVFNAATGKNVFKETSAGMLPGKSILGMRGKVSIDKVHRLLYCSDLWGTYCLKLPDKWE